MTATTTRREPARAEAPGKVILLGEHFVVHGSPAIALAVDPGATVEASPAGADRLVVPQWALDVPRGAEDVPLARALDALLGALDGGRDGGRDSSSDGGDPIPAATWTVRLELPGGAGLGSSAAIGVAVARAACRLAGRREDLAALFDAVFAWERVFHGNPSGFDHAVSLAGGAVRYTRAPQVELRRITIGAPLTLVVAQVEPGASTATMVAGVAQWRMEHPERFAALMRDVDEDAAVLETALARGDASSAGAILDRAHERLREIGVSTPALDHAVRVAREAGAAGAKLLGAGGGGCIVALAATADASTLVERLRPLAITTLVRTVAPSVVDPRRARLI